MISSKKCEVCSVDSQSPDPVDSTVPRKWPSRDARGVPLTRVCAYCKFVVNKLFVSKGNGVSLKDWLVRVRRC